jgi:hypothetical protein
MVFRLVFRFLQAAMVFRLVFRFLQASMVFRLVFRLMTDPHHLFGQPDLYTGIPIPFKGVNEMLRDLFSRWPVIKQIKNGGNGTGVEAMSERSYGNSSLE